jgi:hypothetical protein
MAEATKEAGKKPIDRVIRVFVSSTFADMHAEREELVKRVFPELRRRCDSRGVVWSEVDLRWGVTDEQKAEGKVLPICLAEIQKCRPYFIGLLGGDERADTRDFGRAQRGCRRTGSVTKSSVSARMSPRSSGSLTSVS